MLCCRNVLTFERKDLALQRQGSDLTSTSATTASHWLSTHLIGLIGYTNRICKSDDTTVQENGSPLSPANPLLVSYCIPHCIISPFHFSLLANEIIWNVIRDLINALPEPFREAQEKYIQSFANVKGTASRSQTCTRLTDSYFAYATALLFVNENLSEDARIKAVRFYFNILLYVGGIHLFIIVVGVQCI